MPNQSYHEVSDRCLRCYREQYWYGDQFLFQFIGDEEISNQRILEIGCAEAGLLKYYHEKGAKCSGMELSDVRFNNALFLNDQNSLHLFQANICEPDSYQSELKNQYDTIIIRDVIEHIESKEIALRNIFGLLKPGGKLFMSFPPKYCAYAGHQQTVPTILGKIPYLHLLPNDLYVSYLRFVGCPEKKIDYLIATKQTRISIRKMRKLIHEVGFKVVKENNYFLRPAYGFRFGLPTFKNLFAKIPVLDELLCNGLLYLLERPEN